MLPVIEVAAWHEVLDKVDSLSEILQSQYPGEFTS
jgi:hypothetical protein